MNAGLLANDGPTPSVDSGRAGGSVGGKSSGKGKKCTEKICAGLCNAASRGDIQRIRSLLKEKADINQGDYDFRTAIHLAASEGKLNVVKFLINGNADINVKDRWGGTPLDDATRHHNPDVKKFLESRQARSGKTAVLRPFVAADLCNAASHGNIDKLRSLKEEGVAIDLGDYDGRTAIHLAASEGQFKAVEILVEQFGAYVNARDRWEGTPLDDAIRHGHKDVQAYLKSKGGERCNQDNIRKDPATALCSAAFNGDVEQLRSLVRQGLDVNMGDYDMRTAIHLAACRGAEEVVKCVVELKANVNVQDRWGGTPLDDAVRHNHLGVKMYLEEKQAEVGTTAQLKKATNVELATQLCNAAMQGGSDGLKQLRSLHSRDVNINLGDYDRRTAIHVAASEGHLKIVKALVEEFNALVNVEDRWGGTPLDDAIRSNYADVESYLKEKNGQRGSGSSVRKDDATDLCTAAHGGDIDKLCTLVSQGVLVDTGDYDMRTALHLAASVGRIDVVKCLVGTLKADLNVKDRWGGTPLDDAIREEKDEVRDYLTESGAVCGDTLIEVDTQLSHTQLGIIKRILVVVSDTWSLYSLLSHIYFTMDLFSPIEPAGTGLAVTCVLTLAIHIFVVAYERIRWGFLPLLAGDDSIEVRMFVPFVSTIATANAEPAVILWAQRKKRPLAILKAGFVDGPTILLAGARFVQLIRSGGMIGSSVMTISAYCGSLAMKVLKLAWVAGHMEGS